MVKSKYKVSNFMSYLIYAVAIITSGAYLGNLINMGMVHATFWLTLDPVQFMNDFAGKFDLLVTTLPVTRLPSLIAIIIAIWITRKTLSARNYWLGALLPAIIGLGISAYYFLPMNNGFIEQSFTPEEARTKLEFWYNLHWVRVMLSVVSCLFTFLAFRETVKAPKLFSSNTNKK